MHTEEIYQKLVTYIAEEGKVITFYDDSENIREYFGGKSISTTSNRTPREITLEEHYEYERRKHEAELLDAPMEEITEEESVEEN